MSKQSPSAHAASSLNPPSVILSDRLDAIGRYLNLRDWSFAIIDLMEVAGKAMTGNDRIVVCDQTLTGVSGLLRDLLQQIEGCVDVIKHREDCGRSALFVKGSSEPTDSTQLSIEKSTLTPVFDPIFKNSLSFTTAINLAPTIISNSRHNYYYVNKVRSDRTDNHIRRERY